MAVDKRAAALDVLRDNDEKQQTDALAELRSELTEIATPEVIDYIIERTIETVRHMPPMVTLGGSWRLAAVWGTAALFYVDASKFAGDSSAYAAYQLTVLAAREAREFFAHMDRACTRNGTGVYQLSAAQLQEHATHAQQAMRWIKVRKQAENKPLDT